MRPRLGEQPRARRSPGPPRSITRPDIGRSARQTDSSSLSWHGATSGSTIVDAYPALPITSAEVFLGSSIRSVLLRRVSTGRATDRRARA